jgi:predicted amidophosphoribosyltransferase
MLQIPSKSVWTFAGALSLYSIRRKPFVQYTDLGRAINKYKYHFDSLTDTQKREIELMCFEAVISCLQRKYPIPPFNIIIPVPPNNDSRISLGHRITELCIDRYKDTFVNGSQYLKKTREIKSIKSIPGINIDERKEHLKNAYRLEEIQDVRIRGFLVIDDVYQTGTTVRGIAQALQDRYSETRRYLVTLTALKENGFKEIPC